MRALELSIVIPCLNEAETIQRCVQKAHAFLSRGGVNGEIIVADNGSTDGSQDLARKAGARVVDVDARGYGAAILGGLTEARGTYVIVGDADDSYDFGHLESFIAKLREGHQLVMGNRFKGGIQTGAMPLLHRYLGNPVLSFLGRLFFRTSIGDFHCGLRGFERKAILDLQLRASGMEFASEMIVKSALAGLSIAEVPTTLSKDGRSRPPHLRTWRDGWRHLTFLLTLSPRWLFLYPGLLFTIAGAMMQGLLGRGAVVVGKLGFDIHTMLYCAALTMIGVQMVWFAVFARFYGARAGLFPAHTKLENALRALTLERGLALGITLFAGGLALGANALSGWAHEAYGALDPGRMMRTAIPSVTMMVVGMEFGLASFFLNLLKEERAKEPGQQPHRY